MAERLIEGLAVRNWGESDPPTILLWPGLYSTGGYFASVAQALPGRGVAVDPPGCGASPTLDPCTYERLVAATREVFVACSCRAVVGHSLGAYMALALAVEPPPGLQAVVLIDGGFLDAAGFAELGMPATEGRSALSAWMAANTLRFPDWEAAVADTAAIVQGEPNSALDAYVREVYAEVDGEVREAAQPDEMADLLLAALDQDVNARAGAVRVPTLLIASGEPADQRAPRQRAWERFAARSALIDLHVADGWTHNPILQDPDACSRLIAAWLSPHLRAGPGSA